MPLRGHNLITETLFLFALPPHGAINYLEQGELRTLEVMGSLRRRLSRRKGKDIGMEKQFAKHADSLPVIFDFVTQFVRPYNVTPEQTRPLEFAIEEIFMNMVKYNTESQNDVTIQLALENNTLSACLIDRDVHSFDPTTHEAVDIHQPLHERTPGGLGLHLVKKMMDDVIYEYSDRACKITLIKRLGV